MTVAVPSLPKLLPQVPTGNVLLLPQVARAALFAAHPGPAVLLTTPDRLPLYETSGALGSPVSVNPGLREWDDKREHVVMDVRTALDLFPARPEDHALTFKVGRLYSRDELLSRLEKLGYERLVDGRLDELGFILRGDTLDLYLSAEAGEGRVSALRAEFFGDELDTLRQLSADGFPGPKMQSFAIAPTEEYLSEVKWDATRLELLPGRIFLDAPEFYASSLGVTTESLWAQLLLRDVTSFGRAPLPLDDFPLDELRTLPYYRARLNELARDIDDWRAAGYRVLLLVRHDRTAAYLSEKLLEKKEPTWLSLPRLEAGELGFLRSSGEGGFVLESGRTVVLTEDLIYGFQGGSALRGKKLSGKPVTDALGLAVGDYLIHPEHGIGQFQGLETRTVLGVTRDYLNISYKSSAALAVPIELLPTLRRHPGTTDDPPALSSLDKNAWTKAKERARKNAEEVAGKLLVQYAARQVTPGNSFAPNPEWEQQIEDNFQFELTADQKTALKETLRDLEAPNPADRLISGDVGFGKTEVALRAAHRVVGAGMQVAVLVPTTLLAEQHTSVFVERFKDLPVRVEGLSRFTNDKQAKQILADLAAGKVDILIGTHRLLSGDIVFKNLGLIVVDEEHRFGVSQKEKLRALRGMPEITREGKIDIPEGVKAIDTLALSATPIPRTLYMSMVGLRDMSSIQTPPKGRRPIQTILAPFDPVTVRDAIISEIERGGKVFYIHDRIASIGARSLYLRNLVAGSPHRRGAWPHERGGIRGDHARLRGGRVRRADLHHHRRNRAGHSRRQHHPDRAGRPPRVGAVVPASRAGRAAQHRRLRLPVLPAAHDRERLAAAVGHRRSSGFGQRPPAGRKGHGDSRRRQHPGRGAARACAGRQHRRVHRAAGRGGGPAQGRTRSKRRPPSASICRSAPASTPSISATMRKPASAATDGSPRREPCRPSAASSAISARNSARPVPRCRTSSTLPNCA